MTRLKIALMAGGDSPEREIALQSAAQIESALDLSLIHIFLTICYDSYVIHYLFT